MLENDFYSDILDLTSYQGFFFLCPEMENDKEIILKGVREVDELCRREEKEIRKNRTPSYNNRQSLLKSVSRTATITKKRPQTLGRSACPQTEIKAGRQTTFISTSGTRNSSRSNSFSTSFFEETLEDVQDISHQTYTFSPSHITAPKGRRSSTFDEQNSINLSQATYTCSPRRDVMSTTYDKEKSYFNDAQFVDDSFNYDSFPSRSRTSSSETFTKAIDSLMDSKYDESFPFSVTSDRTSGSTRMGSTSLSSDDLSECDPCSSSVNKYSTYSRNKNHSTSRSNIPLSFSSNLSSVSSFTGGSETSLNSGLNSSSGSRLVSAIGSNGSQTISRGKIPLPSTKICASSVVRCVPRASNLIKPKTFNGSRMRLPTNSSCSSSYSHASVSQSSSQNDLHDDYNNDSDNRIGSQKQLLRTGTFRVQNSQAYKPLSNIFKAPQPPAPPQRTGRILRPLHG